MRAPPTYDNTLAKTVATHVVGLRHPPARQANKGKHRHQESRGLKGLQSARRRSREEGAPGGGPCHFEEPEHGSRKIAIAILRRCDAGIASLPPPPPENAARAARAF